MASLSVSGLTQHPLLRQFFKFCVVGATSAVIDVGLFSFFHFHVGLDMTTARIISFSCAVVNSFLWNSLWTFKGMGEGARHKQFVTFLSINIVGLLLNLVIMRGVFFAVTGHMPDSAHKEKVPTYIALGVAIVLVSVWNFLASRKWTFKGESAV